MALTRCEADKAVAYSLDARLCDGCGDCKQVCAEQALGVERAEAPADMLEAARLPVELCPSCRNRRTGLVEGLCVLCRQDAMRL